MSTLAWFEGKVGEEYETARWVHAENAARIAEGDVAGLAEQCTALFRVQGVFCGTMINGFQGKQEVLNDALDELRAMVRTMPDEVCEKAFAAIEKGNLPVHISDRRKLYDAAKEARLEATIAELRHRLATCNALELVDATATIVRSRSKPILGLTLPGTSAVWGELLHAALARLHELLPSLPDDEASQVIEIVRANHLQLEVDAISGAIDERRHRGLLASDGIDEPRNAALEASIAADPDDENAYAVLGDFLQRHGHPRGELIALQLRAETDPSLAGEAQALLAANLGALLGSLAAYRIAKPRPAMTWRRGYIDRIAIEIQIYPPITLTMAQLLERALHHPAGRFIRAVELAVDLRDNAMRDALEILATRPNIVREVVVGYLRESDDPTMLRVVGEVERLWSIPTLRAVTIFGDAEPGTIAHAALETLRFEPLDMHRHTSRAIAHAQLPRLCELDVTLKTNDDPVHNQRYVEHLLARRDLRALTTLRLREAAFTDEICAALATSPLAKQLRVLDVSGGSMTDAGAHILASQLSFIEELVVTRNLLTVAGLERLRSELDNVVDDGQRDGFDED